MLSEEALNNDSTHTRVDMHLIFADSEFNCRGHITANSILELVKDVEKRGLVEPVVIRELWPTEEHIRAKGFQYSLVAGFRRFTSYRVAKAEKIPAHIRIVRDDFEARDVNAVENLQRENLSLWQEAVSIRHYWVASWNREDIARRVSKSMGWVQVRCMLLSMEKPIQEAAEQGYLTQSDIREIYKYTGMERLQIAGRTVDARKNGEKTGQVNLKIRKKDTAQTRKQRTRDEIVSLMDSVRKICLQADRDDRILLSELISDQGTLLPFHKLMAWTNGEITTGEMHMVLIEFARKLDAHYEVPDMELKL
jgi:ParB/RepB/Spo0J family partition protein